MAFGCFLLNSHNFMVTALGSCVEWPKSHIVFEWFPNYFSEYLQDENPKYPNEVLVWEGCDHVRLIANALADAGYFKHHINQRPLH